MPRAAHLLAAVLLCCSPGSQLAQPLEEQEEVLPFEEVWGRSYCAARETVVDILSEFPNHAKHFFQPSCVLLLRCAGCCGDDGLECVPLETRSLRVQVVQISPGQGAAQQMMMTFTEHTKCACRPQGEYEETGRSKEQEVERLPKMESQRQENVMEPAVPEEGTSH